MRKRTWARRALATAIAAIALMAAGLVYLGISGFTYYDNGTWVHTSLLRIYAEAAAGYGAKPINERRLGPDWGSWPHYAARNFTLDLAGLDYTLPLSWEDTASGPGLNVMRPSGDGRTAVATYSPGPRVAPGGKATVQVHVLGDGGRTTSAYVGLAGLPPFTKAYSLTLYRPRFSSVAYVIKVTEVTRVTR